MRFLSFLSCVLFSGLASATYVCNYQILEVIEQNNDGGESSTLAVAVAEGVAYADDDVNTRFSGPMTAFDKVLMPKTQIGDQTVQFEIRPSWLIGESKSDMANSGSFKITQVVDGRFKQLGRFKLSGDESATYNFDGFNYQAVASCRVEPFWRSANIIINDNGSPLSLVNAEGGENTRAKALLFVMLNKYEDKVAPADEICFTTSSPSQLRMQLDGVFKKVGFTDDEKYSLSAKWVNKDGVSTIDYNSNILLQSWVEVPDSVALDLVKKAEIQSCK